MSSPHMISWQRYGYRMIGTTDRFALARMRSIGQGLDLSSSQYHKAGTSVMVGESTTYTPPPAPPPAPVHKVIQLKLGPPPAAPAPPSPPPMQPPPAVVTMAAPVRTLAAANPVCDPCPTCTSPWLIGAGGALLGSLIMYGVGLATREMKKKKGRR